MKELTASNLKNALWETLQEVRTGTMDPGQSDAVAVQAREILRTVSMQLKISHQSERPVPADVIGFSEK